MLSLKIGNSYSQIQGLQTSELAAIRKILSYNTDPQAAFFAGGNFPRIKYMIDAKGNFPTGLLHRVTAFINKNMLKVTINDTRIKPESVVNHKPNFGTIKPYRCQLDALSACRLQFPRGIISMHTGSGKSLVIALIAAKLNVRTLIVVPNLELKKQLKSSLSAIFTDMSNIVVENIDSKALDKAKDFDMLIIDECHHVAARTYQNLNKRVWNGIYWRYFLTATPYRNNDEEKLLFEGIAGEVLYKLDYRQALENKVVVPVEAYYIEVPKQKTDAYTWSQVYSQLVVNNDIRNAMIANLALSLPNVLVLVKEIAHGSQLSDLTNIPFANGQDEETRPCILDFVKGKLPALIGTTGVLGEGTDTKPCEYVIIAGLGKAKSAFMQQIGRAVRLSPGKESAKVIIIKDSSHKFLVRHFKEQCKILAEEYGIIPTKLDI